MSVASLSAEVEPQAGPPQFRAIHVAHIALPLVSDFVSTIFFAGLYALTHSLLLAPAVGVAVGAGQIGWRLATRRPVAAMQWAGLGLVVVTAAIANVTLSPLVVMLKPSLIYAVIGAAMLQRGWMLRYAIPMARSPIPPGAYVAAGYFVAALMLASGALNLYVALATDAKTWAAFIAVYPLVSKLVSFGLVGVAFSVIARHNKRRGVFFPGVVAGAQGTRS
jgi:intracellular septation protein A